MVYRNNMKNPNSEKKPTSPETDSSSYFGIDSPFFVRRIAQKDQHVFWIEWTDGKVMEYRLSDLQRNCPCIRCKERAMICDIDVQASCIKSVGRYALKVDFTSGCSRGIYTFSFLRKLCVC